MISRQNKFVDRILALIPINNLAPRLQDQVLEQGDLVEYRRKKKIFKEGARDAFAFYLIDGELELQAKGEAPVRMRAADSNALRAIAQLQPRRYTAVALTDVSMFRIDRNLLEHIISQEQVSDEGGLVEVEELEDDEGADWMTRLISSELFTRLPHDNIQRFFTELEAVPVSTGDVVVEQGTEGDYLYIVAEGKCTVTRKAPGSGNELQLAVLKAGDTFGEEALISNAPRNASVKMLSPGFVMRLPKQKFLDLVSNPTLKAVTYDEARKMVDGGAVWLDVRFPDEHQANAIDKSLNIPLNMLRMEAPKLDSSRTYIAYCDTGARSSTGAFLMARIGMDVCYLSGGLDRMARMAGGKPARSKQDAPAKPAPSSKPTANAPSPRKPDKGQAPAPRETADKPSSAASSSLRVEFAKLKAERDKAAVQADKAAEVAKTLRRRYETQQKLVEAEQSKREKLEKELAAAKADAERQSGIEQSRLKGELDKASKKLKELQQIRGQLEARLESVRKDKKQTLEEAYKLKADSAQTDKLAQERDALRKQLEETRAALEKLRMSKQDSGPSRTSQNADGNLKGDMSKLAAERAELNANLEKFEEKRRKAQARIDKERETLEQKEQAIEKQRASLQAELKKREAILAKAEEELSKEKADWKAQLEKAIADERARLEKEYAKYKNESGASMEKRARELAEQQVAEARMEYETRMAEIRAEADARVDEVRTEFREFAANASARTEALVAKVRAEYEARLKGQGGGAATGASAPAAPPADGPDLSMEPDLTIHGDVPTGQDEDFDPQEPTSGVPVLEIYDDGKPADDFVAKEPADAVPELEMEDIGQALENYVSEAPDASAEDDEGDEEQTLEEFVAEDPVDALSKGDGQEGDDEEAPDGKDRVLTPEQIADIRRKMQAKMKATKKSA